MGRPELGVERDRLVIYPSRFKALLVLLGSIVFVLLGLWIGPVVRAAGMWEGVLASYGGVVFFGACGLYAAYRLVRRQPAVEVDSTGITDRASALGVGYLMWEEVDHVRVYEYSGQRMLGVVPRNLDLFLSRQNPLRRRLTRMNISLGCAPVNIPQVILPMKLAELADLLRTRYGVRVEGG